MLDGTLEYYKSIVAVVMKPSSSPSPSAPHGLIVALRGSHDQPIERKSSFHISTCRTLFWNLQESFAILKSCNNFPFCRGHSLRDTSRTNDQRTKHDPPRKAQTEGQTQLSHVNSTRYNFTDLEIISRKVLYSLKDVE